MKPSRRDIIFRFGPAAALLLPILRSTRAHAQVAAKKRFVTFFASSGVEQDLGGDRYDGAPFTPSFWPAGSPGRFDSGSYNVTGQSTQPLLPHLSEVIFLKGIYGGHESGDAHDSGTVSLLTGQNHRSETAAPFAKGESIDGIFAAAAPASVPEKLLNLGVQTVLGRASSYLSYVASGQHRVPRLNPYDVYSRVVSGAVNAHCASSGGPPPPPDARTLRRRSVLDAMRRETAAMQQHPGLGADEVSRLERLQDGIRDIERRIGGLAGAPGGPGLTAARCQQIRGAYDAEGRVAVDDAHYPDILKLHIDLIALAFELDVSRVATLHLSTGGPSGPAMRWLSYVKADGTRQTITRAHHDITHGLRRDVPDMHRQLPVIDTWHMTQFAYLLQKLRAIDEGGQSVLDQSLVWFASDVGVGARHTRTNIPVILAGRAGGAIKPGYYQQFTGSPRMHRLLLTFFSAMGMPRSTFGNAALCAGGPLAVGG